MCRTLFVIMVCVVVAMSGAPKIAFAQPVYAPDYVAVDRAGTVYVTDSRNHHVYRFNNDLNQTARWGGFGSAHGQFNSPRGVAADARGNVFVADMVNARIEKITSEGAYIPVPQSAGVRPVINLPTAIAIDGKDNVYVLDFGDGAAVKILDNNLTRRLFSWNFKWGVGDGEFSPVGGPYGLAVDRLGNVFISDPGNNRIHKWHVATLSPPGRGTLFLSAAFVGWNGACVSGANCDTANRRSRGFTCTAATCVPPANGSGAEPGQFSRPLGLALDPNRNLYVADVENYRIQKFDSTGNYITHWGRFGLGDRPSDFVSAYNLAADADYVYVADWGSHRISKFLNTGTFGWTTGGTLQFTATAGYPASNLDPLLDPNPLFLLPSERKTSTLRLEASAFFPWTLNLSARCCLDLVTGASVSPNGISFALSNASHLATGSGGIAWHTLTILTGDNPTPGKYALTIVAEDQVVSRHLRFEYKLGFEVVVIPADDRSLDVCARFQPPTDVIGYTDPPGPPPSGFAEGVSLRDITKGFFDIKSASPTANAFSITFNNSDRTQPASWLLSVDAATEAVPPLLPTESLVTFRNSTDWAKRFIPFNLVTCLDSRVPATIHTKGGGSRPGVVSLERNLSRGEIKTVRISQDVVSTILLNRNQCGFWLGWCWNTDAWGDIAVFNPASFWTLFGGRHVTIDWIFSARE